MTEGIKRAMKFMSTNRLMIFAFCFLILSIFNAHASTLDVEDFLEEANLRDMALSPDGRYLAVLWNEDTTRTVTIQDLHNQGKIIASLGDKVVRPFNVEWANNDRLLVDFVLPYNFRSLTKKAKKGKEFNIYDQPSVVRKMSVNPQGKDMVVLLSDNKRLKGSLNLSTIQHFLPDDNDHVLILGPFKEYLAIYKVNVYTGKSEKLVHGAKNTYGFGSNEKGDLKYRYDYRRRSKSIQVFDYQKDGTWVQGETIYFDRDDTDNQDYGSFVGMLDDESIIYKKLNETSGYYELVSRDKSGQIKVWASESGKDIEGVVTRPYANDVIGYHYEENDVLRVKYFNKEAQDLYRDIVNSVTALGGSGFSIHSASKDLSKMIIRTNGPNDPNSYFIYEKDTQSLKFYGHGFSKLTPETLGIPAVGNYKTRDGALIRAFFLLPNSYKPGEKYPTIIMPHGGPQSRDYAYYDHFTQYLSSLGYVVIKPNFRGSTGYGIAFERAGYKQWGGLMQRDLEDAVAYGIRSGYTDPDKVCILGFSYGGYAALMGALNTDKLFKCAVSLNGVTHLPKQVKYNLKRFKDEPRVLKKIVEGIGHPKEDKAMLEEKSPALHAEKVSIPVLLVAGTKDIVVPYDQQRDMRKALKKYGKDFEFVKLKNTGHNPIYYHEDIKVVYPAVANFLKKHLGVHDQTQEK